MTGLAVQAFLAVFLAWLLTTLLKGLVVRDSLSEGHRNGGIVSSHTATSSALPIMLYLHDGASPAFLVALLLTIVIGTDAVRVRKTLERQTRALNDLLDEHDHEELPVVEGHVYREVWAGALVGLLVAVGVYFAVGAVS